jgi:hypothetical protein
MHAIRNLCPELCGPIPAAKRGTTSAATPVAIAVRRVIPPLLDSFEFMGPVSSRLYSNIEYAEPTNHTFFDNFSKSVKGYVSSNNGECELSLHQ